MKHSSCSFGANFCQLTILFILPLLFAEPVNAQFFDEDEPPIDEVVTTGQRYHTHGFSSVMAYLDFRDAVSINWINQLASILNAALEAVDVDEVCDAQQADFRQLCLDRAHTANLTCIGTGTPLTAYGFFVGIWPGAVSATIISVGCTQTNYNAVNTCNAVADNFSYPGVLPQCTSGE